VQYDIASIDLDQALEGADLVVVHERNDPALIQQIGKHRACRGGYHLFFHDTHHRLVTDPQSMAGYDLRDYDGVLAYGAVLRNLYLAQRRVRCAWTWHEAADTRIFRPLPRGPYEGDLVWIGNWGDGERTKELYEFLIEPVKSLGLKARVYGVRYPAEARAALCEAGIESGGWLPNYRVPDVFARFRITVHIPRRPYVQALPGIPTIRPFEALACGIPMVCSPWDDAEQLFTPGKDFLMASNGREMKRELKRLMQDEDLRFSLARHGLETIRARHTCARRVDELLEIDRQIERSG